MGKTRKQERSAIDEQCTCMHRAEHPHAMNHHIVKRLHSGKSSIVERDSGRRKLRSI